MQRVRVQTAPLGLHKLKEPMILYVYTTKTQPGVISRSPILTPNGSYLYSDLETYVMTKYKPFETQLLVHLGNRLYG